MDSFKKNKIIDIIIQSKKKLFKNMKNIQNIGDKMSKKISLFISQ